MDKKGKILHPCTHMLVYPYNSYLKGFNKKSLEKNELKNSTCNEIWQVKNMLKKARVFHIFSSLNWHHEYSIKSWLW